MTGIVKYLAQKFYVTSDGEEWASLEDAVDWMISNNLPNRIQSVYRVIDYDVS